jgi:hypothetical protein
MEITAVMAALGVLLLLMATSLWGILRIGEGSLASLQRVGVQASLADQFREDVAQAEAAPERWQERTAGPACLILKRADGGHVIYDWTEERLSRSVLSPGDAPEWKTFLDSGAAEVVFTRPVGEEPLLTMRLVGVPGRAINGPPLEITAAVGGDLR